MAAPRNRKYDGARALYESGLSTNDCAKHYGIFRKGMYEILKARNTRFRTGAAAPRVKRYENLVALYDSGLSLRQLGEYFNVNHTAIWLALRRRGAKFRPEIRVGRANSWYRGGKSFDARAHNLVQRAIQQGIMTPEPCEVCGVSGFTKNGKRRVQAHHADYNKPLEVSWLCRKHHLAWHRQNRAITKQVDTATA